MRKSAILILVIAMVLAAGCQPTPEVPVVVGKGEEQIETMIEKSVDANEPPETKQEAPLVELQYDAPDKLEYDIESDIAGTAAMKIRINAPVELPQYTLPIIKVKPRDMSYEQVSGFVDMVQGDRAMYHSQYAGRIKLKKDIQNQIDKYAWEIEMCADDPEMKDLATHYQNEIKKLLNEMESAPDTYADADIQPEDAAPNQIFVDNDGNTRTEPAREGAFVLTEDYIGPFELTPENFCNSPFSLVLGEGYDADSLVIAPKYGDDRWERLKYWIYNGSIGAEIQARNIEGGMDNFALAQNEAAEAASKYAQIIDPALALTDISDAYGFDIYSDDTQCVPVGYTLYYSRQYRGVDTNYAEQFTWNDTTLQDADAAIYQRPYPQEYLLITVGEDGIKNLQYTSPLEVVETVSTDAALLPFEKIKEKFEQYIVLNTWFEESTIYLNINKVKLGMMRIAQPNSDEYLVIPVWDFYGSSLLSSDRAQYTDDEYWEKINEFYGRSFLTINAIDGSIINRELGY